MALSHSLHKELHQKVLCSAVAPRYTEVTPLTSQVWPLKDVNRVTLET